MAPLTVLRLKSTDLALVERQLRVKIAQLPQMFLDAPVLLDFGAMSEGDAAALALRELLSMLRSCKLVPVAATNLSDEQRARAVEAGLGFLQSLPVPRTRDGEPAAGFGGVASHGGAAFDGGAATASASAAAAGAAAGPTPALSHGGPMVINQPVRSGQVIYAQNNDLVVLAPVNPGAQVIADGHLHVYAPLRGRAVAGAQGLLGARIFCQKLEAELVAISGAYVMAEEIPADRRGKPAQVFLESGECRITAL
jgi:septum site-determining protein MinC